MKKINFLLLFFFFVISGFTLKSQINNADFEAGSFNYWNGSYNLSSSLNCGTSTPNPSTTGGIDSIGNNPSMQIVSFGFDPLVKTTNLPVNNPFGGSYSVRLGDTLNGCGASYLFHSINTGVNNADLSVCYAVVLYDTGYSFNEAPKFIFQVLTAYNDACILCDTITVGTDTAFHLADPDKPRLYYTRWKKICVDLLPYVGMTTIVNFISSDCNNRTHLGYAYVDCVLNACYTTTDIKADSIFAKSIILYPNPAADYFNLTVESLINDEFEITLCDIKGAVLLKDNFNSSMGKTSKIYKTDGLSKGIYFLSIKATQQGTVQKKIIIN